MQDIQSMKVVTLLQPETKNNGDFTNNTYVDTQGWGHLRVLFVTGVITASAPIGSTAEGTAPLVEECDTAVTGAALADAIADDEDDKRFAIDIDLNKTHKRYMRVQAPHCGDGTPGASLCILGILSRPNIGPKDAAGQEQITDAVIGFNSLRASPLYENEN